MKKSFYVVLIVVFIIAVAVNVKKVEKPKQVIQSTKPAPLFFCKEEVPIERSLVNERLQRQISEIKEKYSAKTLSEWKDSFPFFFIDEELKRENLPSDLKYVAIVESGLDPYIPSRKGAIGWWQFMENTARQYRLRVDDVIDQRYDLFASTKAALNFLKDLKTQFVTNTWPDALAGYNMDQGVYYEAKTRQNAKDYYQVKDIPQETQEFVYKIIAMKLVMEDLKGYGYQVATAPQTNKYRTWTIHKALIDVEGNVSIDRVIKELKDAYPFWIQGEFTEKNPHILSKILPTGSYYFYVYERDGTS